MKEPNQQGPCANNLKNPKYLISSLSGILNTKYVSTFPQQTR